MKNYKYLAVMCLTVTFFNTSPALAAPAYIDCSFDRGDGVMLSISVAADEATREVTVTNHFNGKSKSFEAVFTPASVSWAEKFGSGSTAEQNIISRESLSFRRTVASFTGEIIVDIRGTCQIQAIPKRAF